MLFYGMRYFHMSKNDALTTTYGEMLDLISCMNVDMGVAKIVKKMTFDEVMQLE